MHWLVEGATGEMRVLRDVVPRKANVAAKVYDDQSRRV